MKNVVVSFKVDEKQKQFINSCIDKNASLKYLQDYNDTESRDLLSNADVLFAWNPPKELDYNNPDVFPKLKFVQVLSAGYDHLDFNLFPPGCRIASNKGAYADPMAEHIMAMVLSLAKKLFINHKKLSVGEFNQRETNISIKNSVFGILGFGGIGKATAKLIKPFGSKIYAVNSSGKTTEKVDFTGTLDDLKFVLEKSDIIIISLPLIKETEDLIGEKELEMMKPDAIIINAARAQIINEEALYDHLKTHPDFYAGIDAWWVEPFSDGEFRTNYAFFDLPNIIGSPHNSALVPGALLEGVRRAAENINLFLNNKKPKNIIDTNRKK